MNTPLHPNARRRQHPLLILAALAVILFCAVGTAAIMGWLPSSKGVNAKNGLSEADRAALSASLQQPGQPGVVTPVVPAPVYSAAPGALTPAYPVQPAQQAAGAYPADAYVAARAPAAPQPVAGYAAQGYAAERTAAYGGSGQGSTASGYDEPVAPVRESYPKTGTSAGTSGARLAQEESSSHWCGNCGNVESIRTITTRARGSGLGAGAGAILGGLLGNQVGGGHGRQLATVAGAVGGAVMGNQVEGNMKANHSYEIRVRLDNGTLRTFHQHSVPQWRTGDRVRIVKGSLRTA
jgi:outer membrane lipoprotein SlyB